MGNLLSAPQKASDENQFADNTYVTPLYAFNNFADIDHTHGNYLTRDEFNKYQTRGSYLTTTDLEMYQPRGNYALASQLDNFLQKTEANSLYQLKGDYQPLGDYALASQLTPYLLRTDADTRYYTKSESDNLYAQNSNALQCNDATNECNLPQNRVGLFFPNEQYIKFRDGVISTSNGAINLNSTTGTINLNGIPFNTKATSFKIGGNESTYYPIAFRTAPAWENNGKFKIAILRPNVGEDRQWKGSLVFHIEGHNSVWGHASNYIKYSYTQTIPHLVINGVGSGPSSPHFIGDILQHFESSHVLVYLKGNTTYRWSGEGITNVILNPDGTSITVTEYKSVTYNPSTARNSVFNGMRGTGSSIDNITTVNDQITTNSNITITPTSGNFCIGTVCLTQADLSKIKNLK